MVQSQLGKLTDIKLMPMDVGVSADVFLDATLNDTRVFIKARVGDLIRFKNEFDRALFCSQKDIHFIKPIQYCFDNMVGALIFPYIEGKTLDTCKGSLSKKEIDFVRTEVSSILNFLHKNRLDHIDLHGSNLLFQTFPEYRLYVIDLEYMHNIDDKMCPQFIQKCKNDRKELSNDAYALEQLLKDF